MAKQPIKFSYTQYDTGFVARGSVPVMEGVHLKEWRIYRDETGEVTVAPPSQPIELPSGELGRTAFIEFADDTIRARWLSRIKEEFVKWDEEQRERSEEEEGFEEGDALPF